MFTNAWPSCRRLKGGASATYLMLCFLSGSWLILPSVGGMPRVDYGALMVSLPVSADGLKLFRDVLYELASVGDLPLPTASPCSAKRERDSDSPVSLKSNTSGSTSGRGPPPPPQQQQRPPPPQQPGRVSLSPASLAGSSGTPFDQLYSHPSDAFAQQPAPSDILSHPAQTQGFAYAHLPTHSDELARVPGHVFHSAEAWLTAAAPHEHRHQQHQHAAAPIYVPTPVSHQHAYGTPPSAEAYTTYVASSMGAPSLSTQTPGAGQVQDGSVDIWHTMPSGYECVLFPFYSGAGSAPRVGDWLIGGTGSIG